MREMRNRRHQLMTKESRPRTLEKTPERHHLKKTIRKHERRMFKMYNSEDVTTMSTFVLHNKRAREICDKRHGA
jgi:hypothetical protein